MNEEEKQILSQYQSWKPFLDRKDTDLEGDQHTNFICGGCDGCGGCHGLCDLVAVAQA